VTECPSTLGGICAESLPRVNWIVFSLLNLAIVEATHREYSLVVAGNTAERAKSGFTIFPSISRPVAKLV
jgi:hypothetical protein